MNDACLIKLENTDQSLPVVGLPSTGKIVEDRPQEMLRPNKGHLVYSGSYGKLYQSDTRDRPSGYQISIVECEFYNMKRNCNGGAGSPLVCNSQLRGIAMWNSWCDRSIFPNTYTNVSHI